MTRTRPLPVFSSVEVAAILAATPSRWWHAFITLGVSCGLRVDEALWLAWSDIDFRTMAISITSRPVSTGVDLPALPRPMRAVHRERVVPLSESAADAIVQFRDVADPGPLVFVPHWRLENLWTDLSDPTSIKPGQLAPALYDGFRFVQRFARLELARRLDATLDQIQWPVRPLVALRNTFAVRVAEKLPPARLAEALGVREVSAVEKFRPQAMERAVA